MGQARKFTTEQKLEVLQYAEHNGVAAALRKYEIAQSLYYKWKDKFNSGGVDALKPHYHRVDPQLRAVEEENERLKKIVAKQALMLQVQEELLKKSEQREAMQGKSWQNTKTKA